MLFSRKVLLPLGLVCGLSMLGGCNNRQSGEDFYRGEDKWNDPNYQIIPAGSYNYTENDIYDVFILPPDKNDIDYSSTASGYQAMSPDAKEWESNTNSANFAWDFRWKTPKKVKIWWFKVVDKEKFTIASNTHYNQYSEPETISGGAWCEAETEITTPAIKGDPNFLLLHFFPDGHVEAGVYQRGPEKTPIYKVKPGKQLGLPKLQGKACLKEIKNPYFGKKKPIEMY